MKRNKSLSPFLLPFLFLFFLSPIRPTLAFYPVRYPIVRTAIPRGGSNLIVSSTNPIRGVAGDTLPLLVVPPSSLSSSPASFSVSIPLINHGDRSIIRMIEPTDSHSVIPSTLTPPHSQEWTGDRRVGEEEISRHQEGNQYFWTTQHPSSTPPSSPAPAHPPPVPSPDSDSEKPLVTPGMPAGHGYGGKEREKGREKEKEEERNPFATKIETPHFQCSNQSLPPPPPSSFSLLSSLSSSLLLSLNPSVSPCQNFYLFACEGWIASHNETTTMEKGGGKTEAEKRIDQARKSSGWDVLSSSSSSPSSDSTRLPPSESSWAKTFSVINQKNQKIIRKILECDAEKIEKERGKKERGEEKIEEEEEEEQEEEEEKEKEEKQDMQMSGTVYYYDDNDMFSPSSPSSSFSSSSLSSPSFSSSPSQWRFPRRPGRGRIFPGRRPFLRPYPRVRPFPVQPYYPQRRYDPNYDERYYDPREDPNYQEEIVPVIVVPTQPQPHPRQPEEGEEIETYPPRRGPSSPPVVVPSEESELQERRWRQEAERARVEWEKERQRKAKEEAERRGKEKKKKKQEKKEEEAEEEEEEENKEKEEEKEGKKDQKSGSKKKRGSPSSPRLSFPCSSVNSSVPFSSRLLGFFYSSCMDTKALENAGLTTFNEKIINQLEKIQSKKEMIEKAGALVSSTGIQLFFSQSLGANPFSPSSHLITLSQGGTSFGSPSYLIGPTNVTEGYKQLLIKLFSLAGRTEKEAEEAAERVKEFEVSISRFQLPPADLRHPEQFNHLMEIGSLTEQIEKNTTNVPLGGKKIKEVESIIAYSHNSHAVDDNDFTLNLLPNLLSAWTGVPLTNSTIVNVQQPTFFSSLSELIRRTPLSTLKEYAYAHAILSYASSSLPSAFSSAVNEFFGGQILGLRRSPPRWRVCSTLALNYLTDILAGEFLKLTGWENANGTVNANELNAMINLMHGIRGAFSERLNTPNLIDWMSEEDKQKSKEKLDAMIFLFGYHAQSKRLNYSTVVLTSPATLTPNVSSLLLNVLQLHQFNWQKDVVDRLNQPVDRERFQMSASTVNAYYDPTLNSMNFPRGILQSPFFSSAYPASWNFASIGAVMGHELTHGFDDEGRKYDSTGALRDWWSEETKKKFNQRIQCLVGQYDQFLLTPITNQTEREKIHGFLTLGENIADQGGITLAYQAWMEQRKNSEIQVAEEIAEPTSAGQGASSYSRSTHDSSAFDFSQNLLSSLSAASPLKILRSTQTEGNSVTRHSESQSNGYSPEFLKMREYQPALKKLTEEQLFFLGYAQSWCRVFRPSAFLRTLASDPHSPSEARVNVPLNNFQQFRDAFKCETTEKQKQQEKECKVW